MVHAYQHAIRVRGEAFASVVHACELALASNKSLTTLLCRALTAIETEQIMRFGIMITLKAHDQG